MIFNRQPNANKSQSISKVLNIPKYESQTKKRRPRKTRKNLEKKNMSVEPLPLSSFNGSSINQHPITDGGNPAPPGDVFYTWNILEAKWGPLFWLEVSAFFLEGWPSKIESFLGSRYVNLVSIGDQSPINYWTRLPSTAVPRWCVVFFQDTVMECSEEPCEVRITLGLCTKTSSTDQCQYESTHSLAIVNTKMQVEKRLFGATPSKNLFLPFFQIALGR